ncbi:alpha/beta hydrolase [Arhodomonas sp. AD133]|uniref:alpha/beta hydrolase n=1 Tax=Arhodomonas sp. AD133 TaxID=3415009 RepID=UPI003EBABE46
MLFATNRTPRQSPRTRIDRPISFDPQNTTAAQHVFFCERNDKDDYTEIGGNAFFERLRDLPGDTQVLLYIHGFNSPMEEIIFPHATRLQELLDEQADATPHGVTDTRVHVVPLIWPTEDDHRVAILDDYWDDQRAADASGLAFARMLGKFDRWRTDAARQAQARCRATGKPMSDFLCTRRINVLAHSMGNRVLRGALKTWTEAFAQGRMPMLFRNVFMVAADVINSTLEADGEGRYIPDSGRNVLVYYAADDLAMPASKLANLDSRTVSKRLGMTGPQDLQTVPKNVYEVDCADFNNTFDPPQGHSYFLASPDGAVSPVLVHMYRSIRDGRVPDGSVRHQRLAAP